MFADSVSKCHKTEINGQHTLPICISVFELKQQDDILAQELNNRGKKKGRN